MQPIDVSVVIPCHNSVEYIDQCIGSIVRQKGVEIEIIAVDDCSTDDTWQHLQSLSKTVPNLRLERLAKNAGQATARNIGIASARGRYIALLDSDDAYRASNVMKRWVKAADRDHLDLCIAQFSVLKENGRIEKPASVPPIKNGVGSVKDAPMIANTAQSWQILFRREFLSRKKLSFSNRLRQREDRLFFIHAFLMADRIGVTEIDAILYRKHANSTMRKIDYNQLAQFNTHMEIMSDYFEKSHDEGRVHKDFERANAISYWRQALEYWNPLIYSVLSFDLGYSKIEPKPGDAKAARQFLKNLHRLTFHCEPLLFDSCINENGTSSIMSSEGTMDVARMALAADRMDILHQILKHRWQRIHHSTLTELVKPSDFDWAEEVVMQYLKYSRNSIYAEEKISTHTPKLSNLVKRVIIHVGTTKTGSSAFQEFMENNRFRLLEKAVYYPIYGVSREQGIRRQRSSGHLMAIKHALNHKPRHQIGQHIAAEIDALPHTVDTLVISSENILSHLIWPKSSESKGDVSRDIIGEIADALGVEQVEVVATFRRQDDWFKSFYREVTANPMNNFIDTPQQFFDTLDSRGLFDYETIISRFSTSRRISALHINSFGNINKSGGSIPQFFSILGIPPNGFEASFGDKSNESVSDSVAANVRILKLMRLPRPTAEQVMLKFAASKDLAASSFSLISHSDWDELEERFAPYLKAFDKRFPGEVRPTRSKTEDVPLTLAPDLLRIQPNHIPVAEQIAKNKIVAEYQYMITSKSWKMTAPLRRLITGVKAIRTACLRNA
jgi:glycosyltransferase involved in cell wall biosynthesis